MSQRASFITTCLLIAVGSIPHTVSADSKSTPATHQYTAGADAIHFSLISESEGLSVSWKHHQSPTLAWRLQSTFNGSLTAGDTKTVEYDSEDGTGEPEKSDSDSNVLSTGLTFLMLRLHPSERVNVYYGAGPSMVAERRKSERVYKDQDGPFTIVQSSLSYTPGASAAAGFEVFLTDVVSIRAEYAIQVGYSWRESIDHRYTAKSSNRDVGTTTQWYTQLRNANVGFSFYF